MKKCDFHIHTVPTISDADFVFSLDVLKGYVEKMALDVIAITYGARVCRQPVRRQEG